MPTVPLSPQIAAENNPTPRLSVNAPAATFGGDVAGSLTKFGGELGRGGNELFARGIAMQDLYNHSIANQASADYMEKVGKLHADYNSLQGKDAVAAYPQYIESLKTARREMQDNLPNEATQKMFESSSLGTMGRTIFNGAGHAAAENKRFAMGAAKAQVDASRNAALQNPTDEASFQANLKLTVDNTTAQWKLQGADDETIKNAVRNSVSDLWVDRINGLARTQPFAADKMLSEATKNGLINGEKLGQITNTVRNAMHTVGARNISNSVRSGSDLSWGAKIVTPAQAKMAIGSFESGNNYQALGVEVFGKNGQSRGRALGKYQVMPENLLPWLKEAGLPSMTPQEFLNSPSAQDKVFDTVFGRYMRETGSFNEAASKWFTGRTIAEAGNAKDANGTNVPQYLLATNAVLARNAGLPEQIAAGRTQAQTQSPDDVLFGDYVEQRIIADHNMQQASVRDQMYTNRQTVEGGLVGGKDGKLPTTIEELKAQSPEIDAAWNNLPASEQRRYMNILARNAKGDTNWTDDKLKTYQRLKGMAQSDPAAFLDEDIITADLPLSARKELIGLQVQKKSKSEADPRVTHGMQVLRPTLQAAGITPDRKDDYYRFMGALQGALDDYADQNKKPADAKTIQEIGQRLLQEQAGTGWFSNSKLYELEVPKAEREKIVSDPFWASRGITPTDDQIQRIYVRQKYNQLYGGKPKAAVAGPSVPMSR